MECLIMNYSDEEDVFPSEDGAESTHFTSRILNPDDAIQENIMEIADRPVNKNRTFGFPVVGSPCDLKGDVDNTNESSVNQIEEDGDDNIVVVSDEDDSNDVISPIIISNVESTRQSLTHHMMMTHKIKFKEGSLPTEAQQLISCDFCSYTTKRNARLKKHRQLHTLRNQPIVSCTKCDYKAPRVTLFHHYKNVHGSLMNEKEKEAQLYTCKFCSYTTKFEGYFENHRLSHTVSSNSLVGQDADLETSTDLDKCENRSVLTYREYEESDKGDLTAATFRISTKSLVGHGADTIAVMDSDISESRSESPLSDKEGEKSENGHLSAVVRNRVNSTDESSESQSERSRQFEASTFTGSQKYKNNPAIISDRRIFKCKLCSYSSTIRFGIKRHIATHSEDLEFNQMKCKLCPFKGKSKKYLSNHWLVTHKYEKSKCSICDTFVPAHLKEKHLFKCKSKKNVFQCKECQYKTIYEKLFVSHQMECSNKLRSISRQSEVSRDQDGKLEKGEQRGGINEPSKQLHRCEYCSYSTENMCNLKMHRHAHTVSNLAMYRCPECDYKSIIQSLRRHMMATHKIKFKDASLSTETQQLKSCNFCSYTTKSNARLKKHCQLHIIVRNEPIVSCTKCDYKAPRVTLFHHNKNVHGLLMNEKEK